MGPVASLVVADFASFEQAVAHFLGSQSVQVSEAVLAVAGAVENDRVALTNSPWVIDAAALQHQFGFARVRIVNDFEAIAWSVPLLVGIDCLPFTSRPSPRGLRPHRLFMRHERGRSVERVHPGSCPVPVE